MYQTLFNSFVVFFIFILFKILYIASDITHRAPPSIYSITTLGANPPPPQLVSDMLFERSLTAGVIILCNESFNS